MLESFREDIYFYQLKCNEMDRDYTEDVYNVPSCVSKTNCINRFRTLNKGVCYETKKVVAGSKQARFSRRYKG